MKSTVSFEKLLLAPYVMSTYVFVCICFAVSSDYGFVGGEENIAFLTFIALMNVSSSLPLTLYAFLKQLMFTKKNSPMSFLEISMLASPLLVSQALIDVRRYLQGLDNIVVSIGLLGLISVYLYQYFHIYMGCSSQEAFK